MKYLKILIPAFLGLALVFMAASARKGPREKSRERQRLLVRIVRIQAVDVQTRAFGYGSVVPASNWRAVARVEGKVLFVHPELKVGGIVEAGTVLLRLDKNAKLLALSRLEASAAGILGELSQLSVQADNDRARLEIERRVLRLKQRNLERERKLFSQKAVSQTSVDELEQTVLAQKSKVQAVESALALVPAKRAILDAKLRQTRSQLELAKLDVSYTTIKAPFRCRITSKSAQEGDFVPVGKELLTADGTGTAEIPVKLAGGSLKSLIRPGHGALKAFAKAVTSRERMKLMGFTGAVVRMVSGGLKLEWDAVVDRITGSFDELTHAITVVVAVEGHYNTAGNVRRPPLLRGAFCRVEIRGRVDRNRILIPAGVVNGEEVLIVDRAGKIERRRVRTAYAVEDLVVVEDGLEVGDRLVVSDIMPAVEGLSVEVLVDGETEGYIREKAMPAAHGVGK